MVFKPPKTESEESDDYKTEDESEMFVKFTYCTFVGLADLFFIATEEPL